MQGDSWLAVKLRAFQGKLDQLSEKYAQVILWALNNRRFTLGLATGSLAVALLVAWWGLKGGPPRDFEQDAA